MKAQQPADPTMPPEAVMAAALHVDALQRSGIPGERLAGDLRPDRPADGWRIQRAASALRAKPVIGWKCGLPQPDRWIVAALHEQLPAGQVVNAPAVTEGHARVEPELAFVLRHDLPPREAPYTPAEVDLAIASTHLAIEVLGCRFAEAPLASGSELMADSLWHHTLVLGEAITRPVPNEFVMEICRDGQAPTLSRGRHPDGNPRLALYWLGEFLRQQGPGLRAGQTVITGSLAGVVELPFGQATVFRFGELGELSLSAKPL